MQGCPVLPRQGVRLRAALTEEDQRRGVRRGGRHHHWEQVSHAFFYSIHCNENSKQIFPETKLRSATVPKIHVSVIDLPILLQESHFFLYSMHCTENSKQIFPEKELRAATVPISKCMCVCERYIYSHDQSAYSAAGNSLFIYSIHCTENSKQILYSQKRNCAATVPKIHVSVSEFARSICLFCCRKVTFSCTVYTAKIIRNKYSQKRNSRGHSPNFQIHVCLWAIYLFPRSICIFFYRKYVDWFWEYINRSLTHDCGNRDGGIRIRCSVLTTESFSAKWKKWCRYD